MRIATRPLCRIALAAVLLCPSCRSLFREVFRSPRVRVLDVALASNPLADPSAPWAFTVSLEVDNPNGYPLRVAHVAYAATLDGRTVAEGERAEDIEVGASGITVVKVPVTFQPESFADAVRQAFSKRALPYELTGSLGLRAPVVGVVRIPFSKGGSVDPREILRKRGLGIN